MVTAHDLPKPLRILVYLSTLTTALGSLSLAAILPLHSTLIAALLAISGISAGVVYTALPRLLTILIDSS